MNIQLVSIITLLLFLKTTVVTSYCTQADPCWPSASVWNKLGKTLTGKLHKLDPSKYDICVQQGNDPFKISAVGNGICAHYHDCAKAFCNVTEEYNIPAYSVEARTVNDIRKGIAFANKHNIAVTVKTTGHSFSGSSMGKDTLLIWMYNFKKYGNIKKNYKNTCGQNYGAVIKVGGGQRWDEVYEALGIKYHIVGGVCLTVSAAGGWLMGSGLSHSSRLYGLGIDNVVSFDIVLANGCKVRADACSYPDLFWALRGGGGGSFGVVTSVHYRLHPVIPVVFTYMIIHPNGISNEKYLSIIDKWIDFWVKECLRLDNRWGGHFSLDSLYLYFFGNKNDAQSVFISRIEEWKNSLPNDEKSQVNITVTLHPNYYDARLLGVPPIDNFTGLPEAHVASRLISREWVVCNQEKAKETLKYLARNGLATFNYFLGGTVSNVGIGDTAVHPAMRKAIWQIITVTERMIQKLRDVIKDTGAGYNHAAKNEPNWRSAFWGSNIYRLLYLKKKYDPHNRLNCWHCFGYQGPEI